jgi:type VI secretion system protein ImpH
MTSPELASPLTSERLEALVAALSADPHRFDFYQTLRRIECLEPDRPRLGRGPRPVDEPVRLGQDPDLSFAPASLASLELRSGQRPRLLVRLFGLLGPNGPLPLHLTEYARERLRHAGDATFTSFLDIFHHRFLSFFYQAWAQAQPHVNRDRPKSDRFRVYVGAFIGLSRSAVRERDAVPDPAKLFHAWALIRQVRNPEGLVAILEHFFQVPVRIAEFMAQWMPIDPRERTFLGRDSAVLGAGAVVGKRVWDRQHKFRVIIGPLTLRQYENFLPIGGDVQALIDWVRLYLSLELDWDVQLVLKAADVPELRLGRGVRLGWTTWVGRRRTERDADDLRLDLEAFGARTRALA